MIDDRKTLETGRRASGERIGQYEIAGLIGAGGMGQVYRVRDARLNRDVALKILPESFARDADRLARFEREAQILASLNHPNIAAIYGVEANALVMELVEGPTLADRIVLGPLPIEDTLAIARQIAGGARASGASLGLATMNSSSASTIGRAMSCC